MSVAVVLLVLVAVVLLVLLGGLELRVASMPFGLYDSYSISDFVIVVFEITNHVTLAEPQGLSRAAPSLQMFPKVLHCVEHE